MNVDLSLPLSLKRRGDGDACDASLPDHSEKKILRKD